MRIYLAQKASERERAHTRTHIHEIFSQEFLWSLVSKQQRFNGGTERKFGHLNVSSTVFVCVILTFGNEERENRIMHTTADHPTIYPSNLC